MTRPNSDEPFVLRQTIRVSEATHPDVLAFTLDKHIQGESWASTYCRIASIAMDAELSSPLSKIEKRLRAIEETQKAILEALTKLQANGVVVAATPAGVSAVVGVVAEPIAAQTAGGVKIDLSDDPFGGGGFDGWGQ